MNHASKMRITNQVNNLIQITVAQNQKKKKKNETPEGFLVNQWVIKAVIFGGFLLSNNLITKL